MPMLSSVLQNLCSQSVVRTMRTDETKAKIADSAIILSPNFEGPGLSLLRTAKQIIKCL